MALWLPTVIKVIFFKPRYEKTVFVICKKINFCCLCTSAQSDQHPSFALGESVIADFLKAKFRILEDRISRVEVHFTLHG